MKSRQYQKRIQQYRHRLAALPAHREALDACLEEKASGQGTEMPESEDICSEVFLHTLAPALVEYVKWVLLEAKTHAIGRLYFVARDGYMMYHVAQIMNHAWHLGLDLRYLQISRHAIRSAEYYFIGDKALDTICVGGIDITFTKLMKRASLSEPEIMQMALLTGMELEMDVALSYGRIQSLKQKLSEIPAFMELIRDHAGNAYQSTTEYLLRQGLTEATTYALVDSGWIGTLQLSLQRVLSHMTGRDIKLTGYYFGIYEQPKGTRKGQYCSFYFAPGNIWRKSRFSNCMFEVIFSAPEGMTLGYASGEAITSTQKNPNAALISRLTEEIERYTREYVNHTRNLQQNHRRTIRMLRRLLVPLMTAPTRDEAREMGKLPFCDDVLEQGLMPLAANWSMEDLRNQKFLSKVLIKANRKKGILRESAWPEGSMTNLVAHPGNAIRQEHLYRYLMYIRKAMKK